MHPIGTLGCNRTEAAHPYITTHPETRERKRGSEGWTNKKTRDDNSSGRMEKHRNHRSSGFVYLFMLLCTDMHQITNENFVYFRLKLFVQMWTYKCTLSQSA